MSFRYRGRVNTVNITLVDCKCNRGIIFDFVYKSVLQIGRVVEDEHSRLMQIDVVKSGS